MIYLILTGYVALSALATLVLYAACVVKARSGRRLVRTDKKIAGFAVKQSTQTINGPQIH